MKTNQNIQKCCTVPIKQIKTKQKSKKNLGKPKHTNRIPQNTKQTLENEIKRYLLLH